MNIKTIIVGSLAVGLAIGGTLLKVSSREVKSVYTPRTYSAAYENEEESERAEHAGYAAYLNMLKADPATGKIDYNLVAQVRNEVLARRKQQAKTALGLNWAQMGPDNVGGRTRAVLVDKYNSNIVYAGSIGGGLFVSTDGSQHWTPVAGMQNTLGENLAVSCIAQTDNGRIFFGTGSGFESYTSGGTSLGTPGFVGNGVYEYVPGTGQVLPVLTNATALPNNSTSSQLSEINSIAAKGNTLLLGTKDGMVWADPDGSGFYPTTFSGWTNPIEIISGVPENGTCQDIDVGTDGTVLACFAGKAYVSPNGGLNLGDFTKISGISGGSRWSGAIAPSNPNVMYLLRSSGSLSGLNISLDKGANWSLIVPGGSPCIDPFNQDDCTGGQGGYDDAIAVDPSYWGHILVGGVQLYEWTYSSGSNPIGGSWLKAANLFESPFNPYYVHADKHTIFWPDANTIYIGSDGGVSRSVDGGASFQERNLGYNVTTFFDVDMAANGWFAGGAQDNGCQLFSFQAFGEVTPLGTTEIQGGDGFTVAFSNQGPGVVYTTSQYGSLIRSAGGAGGTFYDAELSDIITGGGQAFNTCIENWESNYDFTSIDSVQVTFTGPDTLVAGQPFYYSSLSNGSQLIYTPSVTMTVDTTDTLILQDYIQNRFALATNVGVYLTRDAARLNAISPEWYRIANNQTGDGLGSNVVCMEFSPDGNSLFVGTTSGIKRISGLSMANDSLGLDRRSPTNVITISTGSGTAGVVTGIAADPNDPNNLIVTTGGYTSGNHVYRCTNALGALSFTAIQGSGGTALPKMPVYDAEIDYNDKNKVIIGTEWGVWTTDNAFSAIAGSLVQWTDESSNDMAHVPVFAVEQQHLRSTDCVNSGMLYLATHGRGFYTSADLVTSVNDNEVGDITTNNSFVSNLTVYPNPISNTGVVAFDLNKQTTTKLNVYNLSGSLVKTIDLGTKAKGNHKVKFDVTLLSIGSYIISLESGSERSVAKFIVTR